MKATVVPGGTGSSASLTCDLAGFVADDFLAGAFAAGLAAPVGTSVPRQAPWTHADPVPSRTISAPTPIRSEHAGQVVANFAFMGLLVSSVLVSSVLAALGRGIGPWHGCAWRSTVAS